MTMRARHVVCLAMLAAAACTAQRRAEDKKASLDASSEPPAAPAPPAAARQSVSAADGAGAFRKVSADAAAAGAHVLGASAGPRQTRDSAAAEAVTSMIIRTGQASIEVDSIEAAVAKVRQLAQQ